jgi:hypothetical protein
VLLVKQACAADSRLLQLLLLIASLRTGAAAGCRLQLLLVKAAGAAALQSD